MVQGYSQQNSPCSGLGQRFKSISTRRFEFGIAHNCFIYPSNTNSNIGRYPHEQWHSYQSEKFELPKFEISCRKVGGIMLNITGLNKFFFVRDFHDMRCKYDRVLSIIHQQLNREPDDGDVFIVMSKDLRLVRLFSYDQRSYSMFEKRFRIGYKFMQVSYNGHQKIYSINWKDVILLLESPTVKNLKIT